MKKYPIGFNTRTKEEAKGNILTEVCKKTIDPRKSVVQVYFPSRGINLAYYNDSFDLKVGDLVYVDGKLEGHRGHVTEVSYNFKIKLSEYKKVIAVADTNVKGDFYFADSHLVSFDRNVIPLQKVKTWFKAPDNDEDYAVSTDDSQSFPLDDLSQMNVSHSVAERGHDYYIEKKVSYICIDGDQGYAIVEGGEAYEVEFDYREGEISNLICSCLCSYTCKHEFAAMLQLKKTLEFITKNYETEHKDYFAAISKNTFMNIVMGKKSQARLVFEDNYRF